MKIIISGGGTGGHIYPAIAIADAIKRQDPHAEILFVGALGKMEMEKVPQAGYPIEGLWISGLQRQLSIELLKFPFKLLSSWWKSRQILQRFRPNAVVGVGGYASGVIVQTAAAHGIPTLIHEQNSHAGLTNRTLAKTVKKVCVAYPNMERFFPTEKVIYTGNPIRQDILDLTNKRDEAFQHYGLNPQKKTLLVVGGSLGARTLNESIVRNLDALQKADIQVFWQCGKGNFATYEPQAKNAPHVKLVPFIDRMDLAYSLADVVISRAGALAISELCVAHKPAILVPSPNVTDDHQTANARALVEQQAAILVRDAEAAQTLVPTAIQLLTNPMQQQALSRNIATMGIADAADRIAEEVLKMVKV